MRNIDFNGKKIVLIGQNKETTVIDGSEGGTVVAVSDNNSEESSILENFTIINGSGSEFEGLGGNVAGGIYVTQPNTILDNLIIRNNNSGAIGGGLFISTDGVVLRNSIIIDNSTDGDGGGLALLKR